MSTHPRRYRRLASPRLRASRHPALWAAAVAVAFAGSRIHADDPVAADETSAKTADQDVLFLGRDRPIIIRVHLELDGRPFDGPWIDLARRLFTLADQNGDGGLAEPEWQHPPASDDPLGDELRAILGSSGLAQCDVDPPDGVLGFAEFAAFLIDRRGGPFQPPPAPGDNPDAAPQPVVVGQTVNAGNILFKAIDRLPDGQVTLDELRQAPESLQRLDFDRDGASSIDELDHLRSPFVAVQMQPPGTPSIPLIVLGAGEPSRAVIDRVISTYAGADPASAPASLPVERLALPNESPAEFDADADGRLDRDELRYWLEHAAPHVELLARIGTRDPAAPPVEVRVPPTMADLSVKVADNGLVSVIDGDVQLEFGVNVASSTTESLRSAYQQAFKAFDRDGNGYLEPAEAGNAPYFQQSFPRLDRDGDGKVFEEELLHVVEADILVALSRTSLSVADRGQDLFEILDVNRDRRLTRRELLDSLERFMLWDRDDDHALSEQEVPHLYQLAFDRSAPPLPFPFSAADVVQRGPDPGPGTPSWFSRMDRNRDGDVSRREFIGTPAQFEKLDADGDGLIGRAEALIDGDR